LPETKVHVDAATGRIPGVKEPYVFTAQAVQLDEPIVERDDVKGLALYHVVRPLGVASVSSGIYADNWAGAQASYTRFRCHTGETLLATVAADVHLIKTDTTVVATTGGVSKTFTVPFKHTRTLRIPLQADGSRCVTQFRIAPVAQPAAVQPNSTDTRILGIRFLDLRVR
jgi:hypothetical protein